MHFTSEFVTVHGLRLHVRRRCGDGPPLVFLHGLTDNGGCWNCTAAELSRAFDVIAPDLRGHGLSDVPARGYTAADFAGDVIGLIEALELGAVTLVGHSLGADTALEVALNRPDLVFRLVIEDPPWSNEPLELALVKDRKTRDEWARRHAMLKAHRIDDLLLVNRMESPLWSEAERLDWASAKLEASDVALDYILTHHCPPWQSRIRGLARPTLLVIGEVRRGGVVSEAMADEARQLAPQLSVLPIAGAGHSVHRDQFDAYLKGVRQFLGLG